MSALRVGFMGTPDFALAALKAIHATTHEVVCVYSQPPRPKGRGQQVQPSPVHEFAAAQGITVHTPTNLKSAEAQAAFAAHNLDIAVVAAYGLILPKVILDAPKYGCLNIHASLLPRWRGASPIQQAIRAGDCKTGISIMQMDEGLDTGPVLAKRSVSITEKTTASTLHDDLAVLGGDMIVEMLDRLAAGEKPQPEIQDEALVTYAPLLKKEDGRIDWAQPATEIDRLIRAFNPWPGVWSTIGETRFKVLEADSTLSNTSLPSDPNKTNAHTSDLILHNKKRVGEHDVGIVLNNDGLVQCGEGTTLHIRTLQPAGKQAMDLRAALNGGYIKPGDVFK